jgi:hypothetical protein
VFLNHIVGRIDRLIDDIWVWGPAVTCLGLVVIKTSSCCITIMCCGKPCVVTHSEV